MTAKSKFIMRYKDFAAVLGARKNTRARQWAYAELIRDVLVVHAYSTR